jgi:3-hydroxybutyryl-CoA dehydratase
MPQIFVPKGHHFEDFEVGDVLVSAGRTITETDIVNFAGLSGDFTQLHTNAEFARQDLFGQRVAHGLLGLAVASGQMAQLGFVEGTVLAFRELNWKFSAPIYIGDTIHTQVTVAERKIVPRLKGGVINFDVQVINQAAKIVQSGKWALLVANRPG